ncbi:T9SS type A sorting domain-containing protein [Flavobacterium sp. TBRC 19031]|uniref:Ig-like domain-containing protein n=1 Tax=Flavobacterium mekongense TaxID=3379707 RepID=UPI00399A51FD
MKTKLFIVVALTFILTQFEAHAQYNGGNSNGSTVSELNNASCPLPPHFYAYFGGNNDGSGVDEYSTATCGTAAFQFAYMGGTADGAATEEITTAVCGIPPSFYAYMGGNNDGAGVETLEQSVCGFPPQFYAYFGGNGDGFSLDKTTPICPTEPPVAGFTATSTQICVGQTISFTDVSTNIPAGWTWTFEGGTPSSSTVQNPTVTYNTPGVYDVTLVAANYNGTNTIILTDYITVYAYPLVTTTTPAARCDAGTVTLQATTNVGTLNWYDASVGGNLVGTGTSFTTPILTSTTTYYVESVNGVCFSARSAVVATVNTTPSITETTPATRCGAGSVNISVTASTGTVFWYSASSGGTALSAGSSYSPSVTATTTYYAETTLSGCTSPRTPVLVTVNEVPTITATTPASRCDSGTVTLGATASSGTISWYNVSSGGTSLGTGTSFTTPSISTSTNFYVEVSSGICTSTRTAVLATVNVTPSITSATPNSRCDSGSVALFASANAGVLQWYDAAVGGTLLGTGTTFTTPSISNTTTYYVASVNNSCASVRVPVVATVNAVPTVVSTADASSCAGTLTALTATPSEGVIYWYNSASGGSAFATGNTLPVSGGSAIYYAEAVSNGCPSTRVAVSFTAIPVPSLVTTSPASRCGTGTVTIGVNYNFGTINWYDTPAGGNLLGTGSSFTTPAISVSTLYYAEAISGGCSSPRQGVYANVITVPPPTGSATQSFCSGETVGLLQISSGTNVVWYDAAIGGNIVTNNTVLINGATYYASQNPSGCESQDRLAVTVVSGTCLGIKEVAFSDLKVYPNPVVDFLTISHTEELSKVTVVNLLGQIIYNQLLQTDEVKIDMSGWATATYIVKVYDAENRMISIKVIKK